MKIYRLIILSVVVAGLIMGLAVVASIKPSDGATPSDANAFCGEFLPPGAKNFRRENIVWYSYEYNGHKIMVYHSLDGDRRDSVNVGPVVSEEK